MALSFISCLFTRGLFLKFEIHDLREMKESERDYPVSSDSLLLLSFPSGESTNHERVLLRVGHLLGHTKELALFFRSRR